MITFTVQAEEHGAVLGLELREVVPRFRGIGVLDEIPEVGATEDESGARVVVAAEADPRAIDVEGDVAAAEGFGLKMRVDFPRVSGAFPAGFEFADGLAAGLVSSRA